MAVKYFLYSDEQIAEKNAILGRSGKSFVPGTVTIGGRRVKFTQLSNSPTMERYIDTKIVASGELNTFTYINPSTSIKRG